MGWVLLARVKLGYEVWRQFNGFPHEWTGGKDSAEGKHEKETEK
jgi:hypothetical protein